MTGSFPATPAQFMIEKNVPLDQSCGNQAKYPWRQMEIGDSFFVPNVKTNLITNCAAAIKKRAGLQFTCRTVEGGVRVWRTA